MLLHGVVVAHPSMLYDSPDESLSDSLVPSLFRRELRTKINFKPIVKPIVEGCDSDYDKARAIYKWICDNIDYDDGYRVHTADECYKLKRGTAQAYCELYYHMAESLDIKSRIIHGWVKDIDGEVDRSGHAWISTVLDGREVLLDLVRGAVHLYHGEFVHNNFVWPWFDVDPKFLIFTHYPFDDDDQYIDQPIDYEQFVSLPTAPIEWVAYNLNIDSLFDLAINQTLRLPEFYGADKLAPNIELLEIPLTRSLRVGQRYRFAVKLNSDKFDICLVNNHRFTKLDEWEYHGDGIYTIDYDLLDENSVSLSYNEGDSKSWSAMVVYDVDEARVNDWNNVSSVSPLDHPDVRETKNLFRDSWVEMGVDNARLADLIRRYHVTKLPLVYKGMSKYLKVSSIPMNYELHVGKVYIFSFYSLGDYSFAIVEDQCDGGRVWHREFELGALGKQTLRIAPEEPGSLYISFSTDGCNFKHCIKYEVVSRE